MRKLTTILGWPFSTKERRQSRASSSSELLKFRRNSETRLALNLCFLVGPLYRCPFYLPLCLPAQHCGIGSLPRPAPPNAARNHRRMFLPDSASLLHPELLFPFPTSRSRPS